MENNHTIGIVIQALIRYFEGDQRRIQHALKVFCHSGHGKSTGEERLLLSVTALVHDVGIKVAEKKYGSSAGPYQEKEGPTEARKILKEFSFSEAFIERVCYLIAHHHTYGVEADFLVNLYEEEATEQGIRTAYFKYFKTKGGKSLLRQLNPGVIQENESTA